MGAAALLRSMSVNYRFELGALLVLQLHAILLPAGDLHGLLSLRAQARKLAQHGGDRDRRSVQAVPRPAHPGPRDARARGRRLAGAAQRRGDARRLAIQDRRLSSEAEVALPNNSMLNEY